MKVSLHIKPITPTRFVASSWMHKPSSTTIIKSQSKLSTLHIQQRWFAAPAKGAAKAAAAPTGEEKIVIRKRRKDSAFKVYEEDLWGSVILSRDKQSILKKTILSANVPIPQAALGDEEEDFMYDDEEGEEAAGGQETAAQKKKKDKKGLDTSVEEEEETGVRAKKRELYSSLMINKTKIRKFYGVKERYLHNLWEQARKSGGFDKMLCVLEKRLATVLVRSSFVMTIDAARQLCVHGHVLVNNQLVRSPGYNLRIGDVVSFRNPEMIVTDVKTRLNSKIRPFWVLYPPYLEVNYKTMQLCVCDEPAREDVFYPFTVHPAFLNKLYKI